MLIFKLLWLCCLSSIGFALNRNNAKELDELNKICGESNSDRIIGGKNAALGQYPWIIRIRFMISHDAKPYDDCGGSIISKKFVATAAHCLKGREQYVHAVLAGDHNIKTDPDCEGQRCAEPLKIYRVKNVLVHPNYTMVHYQNDIGLLELAEPIRFTEWVKPICMATGKEKFLDFAEVAGWGMTDANDETKMPDILQYVKLKVLKVDDCKKAMPNEQMWDSKQICAGSKTAQKDTCGGDSGGPLMQIANTQNGPKYFLTGIVSYGPSQCGLYPALYTRTSFYLPFIKGFM